MTTYQFIYRKLTQAKRPLMLVGGGAQSYTYFARKLAALISSPVVYSMMGKGVVSDINPNCLGLIGWCGDEVANAAIQQCDLLLILGSRLDVRQTGNDVGNFAPNAYKIHIDIDITVFNSRVVTDYILHEDLNIALPALITIIKRNRYIDKHWDVVGVHDKIHDPKIERIFKNINTYKSDTAIITTDVGQHQIWATQLCNINTPSTYLTSGGLGAMGYGLPAAIGAWFARPDLQVICITGDGSLQMNIQELAVIKQYNIPIKIILFNNKCLGLVRQHQAEHFNGKYTATVDGYTTPDFKALTLAYGLHYIQSDIKAAFDYNGPCLVELDIDQCSNVNLS